MIPILPKREFLLIGNAYKRIEEMLSLPDSKVYAVAEDVSLWSPGQHAYHLALVNEAIFARMKKLFEDNDPEIAYKGSPNIAGWFVLTVGVIPRGRRKAPAQFEAPADVTRAEIRPALHRSKTAMAAMATRADALPGLRGRFPHPALGNLNALQWLKFVRIHMNHHLAIADEALKKAR